MAEFIFDLQRFPENDGAGNSGEGNDNGGGTGGDDGKGGNASGSGSGWETNLRKHGELIFPLFMTIEEADAFAYYSHDVFDAAIEDGAVPYYNLENGIVDSVGFSRLTGSTIINNDSYDVINLVDSNVGNVIEYFWYDDPSKLSIVFDTGAILNFDIDMVSPLFKFANGESMVYSSQEGKWLSGNEAEAAYTFWNTAVQQVGVNDVDNFYVTQNLNTAVFNTASDDNILLYDTASTDMAWWADATDSYLYDTTEASLYLDSNVTSKDITLYFPTGGALVVENSTTFSPNFYFADGAGYYYNRDLGEWRTVAQKAADLVDYAAKLEVEAAAEKAVYEEALYEMGFDVVYEADATDAAGNAYYNFPSSRAFNNYIYDAAYDQVINFYDSTAANVIGMTADDDTGTVTFAFDTGKITTVEYDYNFTPIFQFADSFQVGYDWYTKTWGNAYYSKEDVEENLAISRSNNSLIYQADDSDTIYFTDAVVGNVTNAVTGTKYINLYFDTGAVVNVRYTDEETPTFVFADGTGYVYDSGDNAWYLTSADTASDMWGNAADTADGLFTDGAIVAGATLSDLVAAPVDNAAVSFNADSAFDINAAGGFVAANTAVNSEQKDA
ncbi:MAG: hypothetical protein IKE46_07205 [Selenomonadaceae bacterium]|nr:hypothetical protein [Selenomonadaceae bacterium]